MSPTRLREEALFADALALPLAQRGAFLAQACGANIDLLAHLVALVAAHESPESLQAPNGADHSPARTDEGTAKLPATARDDSTGS